MRTYLGLYCLIATAAPELMRVPHGGIQPQVAVDSAGAIHMIYFAGEAAGGDLFHVRSSDGGKTFSQPMRVNSQAGSAIAMGTIRGGQIALGAGGWIHVAWNGSNKAEPKGVVNPDMGQAGSPMLYSRLRKGAAEWEPQRNLMRKTYGLDGGGTIAADARGGVFVAWHGKGPNAAKGEAGREVWIARSADHGATFAGEAVAWDGAAGACGCCGMKLASARDGGLTALFRSATQDIHRDIYTLTSAGGAAKFEGVKTHEWEINACPMSAMSIAEGPGGGMMLAWETAGQVYWKPAASKAPPISPSGGASKRKHPSLAAGGGVVLLTWTEGTGWQKGGSLAWQAFTPDGKAGEAGAAPGVPVWSFPAAAALPGGRFVIFY